MIFPEPHISSKFSELSSTESTRDFHVLSEGGGIQDTLKTMRQAVYGPDVVVIPASLVFDSLPALELQILVSQR